MVLSTRPNTQRQSHAAQSIHARRTDNLHDQARIPEMTLKIAAERFKTIQVQERVQHDPLWGIRTSGEALSRPGRQYGAIEVENIT